MRQKHINSIIKNEITLNMLKNLSQQSTPDEPKRLQSLIDYTRKLDLHVQQFARSDQIMLPELNFAPNALINLGPKYPARPFSYFDVLAHEENEVPLDDAKLLNEVARYFRGAIRPQSKHALFNMLPAPSVEATAAAWLATAYNTNSLMDAFCGEALLIEQQIARRIGRWAGWTQAMGIACNGGKFTIMYAIKSALSRIAPESLLSGLPHDLIILCSEGAHYCVEHAASLLGLGSNNCLRIPSNANGRMCGHALQHLLHEQHANGRRVAAIVCSGGTTINFNCEDTREVHEIVEAFARKHNLQERPYLHLDSVIGWLYLSLLDANHELLCKLVPDIRTRARITEVLQRMHSLSNFDSLGVDFHKNGLCPYASSFFVARDHRFMDELGDGNYHYSNKDFHYGQFRAYRYTFENSRPNQGILAAWVNLNQLGRHGYATYLASLHEARNSLADALERHGLFRVLNHSSLGWEVVFEAPFDSELIALASSYQDLAMLFMQECWDRVNAGYDLPHFSIVPGYPVNNDPKTIICGFLLYPMQQHSDQVWDETVALIAAQFHDFQTRLRAQPRNVARTSFEKPIR
ncbi:MULTISPECIES: pyridoxal-dependent decarboxylase [unclassified Serratia (in: enterobacteria)]|uniref:pyridoxal phosphate-dependent decarboxylase family protein n=1 Tax=unclassified Serratia (in: enterobacteria) TaxID=2647522 RepID=UPI001CBDBFCC|nr:MULTISPECIES: pyridoxal-dependent decarboxylase [unclassified Serratia (in: enterobacteria)]